MAPRCAWSPGWGKAIHAGSVNAATSTKSRHPHNMIGCRHIHSIAATRASYCVGTGSSRKACSVWVSAMPVPKIRRLSAPGIKPLSMMLTASFR